ncbi:hypothetical protein [Candidatus Methylacidithermus pantelleriae]|uniref:hypothetical protein n=1 Tax=Candidatus Methylacidithermus pantelleriae TaxID=2744239 RepID=UPI00157C140A|nr:hypothetical protein [Candidatus Methylacidithermus pantelleriae]
MSYRFVPDGNGWRAFGVSSRRAVSLVTRRLAGTVGIDTNKDHLPLAATDGFGNLGRIGGIRLNLHGQSKEEGKSILVIACKKLARALHRNGARRL